MVDDLLGDPQPLPLELALGHPPAERDQKDADELLSYVELGGLSAEPSLHREFGILRQPGRDDVALGDAEFAVQRPERWVLEEGDGDRVVCSQLPVELRRDVPADRFVPLLLRVPIDGHRRPVRDLGVDLIDRRLGVNGGTPGRQKE